MHSMTAVKHSKWSTVTHEYMYFQHLIELFLLTIQLILLAIVQTRLTCPARIDASHPV